MWQFPPDSALGARGKKAADEKNIFFVFIVFFGR
jgi:hypothetical protein